VDKRLIRLLAAAALAAVCALIYRSGAVPLAFEKERQETSVLTEPFVSPPPSDAGFDFYVLALSWSPSYCASKGGDADPQQCGLAKPPGFTAHGLWPQFERGSPQNCAADSRNIDRETLRRIEPVMPSDSLARHEWQKHGTCSGLSQAGYFSMLMRAVEKVRIPGQFTQMPAARQVSPSMVETAFLQANPGMEPKGFAAVCGGRYLSEVRICMTKDLKFRACPEVDRKACRANSAMMPPAR
jgi:ribonuclease T2